MSQIKCKMCGGDLQIIAGSSVAECEYCGTRQTLPKLDDERKANLYDRASHFRRLNDYDKAQSIYEQILAEDKTDAELYWSLVLCRYGIEYVEDPRTHKRIPTINRTQFNSILNDEDYLSALRYADAAQKEIFESEAKRIDQIQKGILSISKSEKPYDVFICYKETDEHGRRTIDSVLAQDLYKELTNEGFKVFFSRITLENQLGTAYEPYIFAALNSAKVMVVVGTKPEHFNAVWVKNEWSRYLSLMRNGEHKTLIPAYRDMNPYDLPEEFSYLQGQDMSKIGFMQDLLRGIKKVVNGGILEEKAQKSYTQNPNQENSAVVPLLRRAEIFWEEGNAARATEYLNRVLDMDPENGRAYLQLLLIDFNAKSLDDLFEHNESVESNINYQRIMRYAGDEVKDELYSSRKKIISKRNDAVYNEALQKMQSGDVALIEKAMEEFKAIPSWRDANQLAEKCAELLISIPKDRVYIGAQKLMGKRDISSLEQAVDEFNSISEWKDSAEKAKECRTLIQEIKNTAIYEEASKLMEGNDILNLKKAAVLFASIPGWKEADQLSEYCNSLVKSIPLDKTYLKARSLMQKGDISSLEQAAKEFDSISDWKDSTEKANECRKIIMKIKNDTAYDEAVRLMQSQDISDLKQAAELFGSISDWKDSAEKAEECQHLIQALQKNQAYDTAVKLMSKGKKRDLQKAMNAFAELKDWKDSEDLLHQCQEKLDEQQTKRTANADKHKTSFLRVLKVSVVAAALLMMAALTPKVIDYTEPKIAEYRYNKALTLIEEGQYEEGYEILLNCGYSDAEELVNQSKYDRALVLIAEKKYDEAYPMLEELGDYSNAKAQLRSAKHTQVLEYQQAGDYDSAIALLTEMGSIVNDSDFDNELKYLMAKAELESGNYEEAIQQFKSIRNYKDTNNLNREANYLLAKQYMDEENYQQAATQFLEYRSYKDSNDLANESQYLYAKSLMAQEKYSGAAYRFRQLGDYKDAEEQHLYAKIASAYQTAVLHLEKGKYLEASAEFEGLIGYKDSDIKFKEASFYAGINCFDLGLYQEAWTYLNVADDYNGSVEKKAEVEELMSSSELIKAKQSAEQVMKQKTQAPASKEQAKQGIVLRHSDLLYSGITHNFGTLHSLTAKLSEDEENYQIIADFTPRFVKDSKMSLFDAPSGTVFSEKTRINPGRQTYIFTVPRLAIKSMGIFTWQWSYSSSYVTTNFFTNQLY